MIHHLADLFLGRRNSVIFPAQDEMNNEILIGDKGCRGRTSIYVSAQFPLIRIAGGIIGAHNGNCSITATQEVTQLIINGE